ncbi:CubicO group peptidase, beta-lactamase class C family [Hymenobacter arizonensis]|uniref:CubicO group peptidase, beta-lactamase class C family n=2 Tax=Hymenobacter arizonensis TaxID=1227077 RepID=A0A1I5TNF9_HYMAR|nr:CubicO group peptidase, beta-lactamase class C family [Hymenobacter arizonensis]
MAQTGIAVPELAHCDESMQDFMRRWKVLGASVALSKDGQLVYDRAFGYADVDRTVPLQPYHLMRVASISKSVTALAVMKLVEQGKLTLSHKVFGPTGYLKGAAYNKEIKDLRLHEVTVQQLLEHTGGWDRDIGCDGYGGCDPIDFPTHVAKVMRVPNPVGDSTIIRYMLRQGLNYAPGTRFAYSNIGYLVLGKVVEAVTHQLYGTWVRQNVLEPSGVLEAHLAQNLPTARRERESDYLSRSNMISCYNTGLKVPAAYGGFQVEAMNAHGGWMFSARDLVRLILAADGSDTRPDLLAPATLKSMTTPSALTPWYSKGWMVDGHNWWHTGLLDGTSTLVMRSAGGYTWAILLNTDNNTTQFWHELKALGWNWVDKARKWPAHNLFAPERNASQLDASATDSAHAHISWANGNGSHRLLLLKPNGCSTAFPVDGTVYPEGKVLSDGTLVVANGTASAALLPTLQPSITYYARVVEYRQDSTTNNRPVYTLEGNATLVLQPQVLAQEPPQLAVYTGPVQGVTGASGRPQRPSSVAKSPRQAHVAGDVQPVRNVPTRQQPPSPAVLHVRRTGRESSLRLARQ